jgi:hypothetical protein
MKNNSYILTAKEAIKSLKNFDENGILVDVDSKSGNRYFPKLTNLGFGNLLAYGLDYGSLSREENFDIDNVNVILVDSSDSKPYRSEFIPMMHGAKKINIPDNVVTISNLKDILLSVPENTVIIKTSILYNDAEPTYISPGFLGHYNNESYPIVDEKGVPITMGLTNNQMATFTFIGKSSFFDSFFYKFEKRN